MKDIEDRIVDMVPDNCPILESSVNGPRVLLPTKGKGTAYCLSTIPGNPVCDHCPLQSGVLVDNTNPN